MATTFLEPGSDADFAVTQTNGFWKFGGNNGSVSDIVHGGHKRSIRFAAGFGNIFTGNSVLCPI